MTEWYCNRCGYLNSEDDSQCRNCARSREVTLGSVREIPLRRSRGAPERKPPTVWGGVLLIFIGLFITVCTYSAASGAGGGIYLIAFGPVIAGIVRIIRALEVPKSNATGSAPPRGYQFKPHEKVRILSNRFREKGAPFGSIGYVIEKWADNLWEVEVSRVDGTAIARVVVRPEDIELAEG